MMRRIDLLPARYEARRRERRSLMLVAVAGAVALLLMIVWLLSVMSAISNEEERLAAAQSRNAALQAQINELQRFAQLDAEVRAKRTALQTVMAGDIRWPALLTELAMVIPGEVWLTSMTGSAGATEGATPVGTETAAIRISNKTPVGRISFRGVSLSMPGVAKWLIRLGTADAFSALWLNNATETGGDAGTVETVTFDSTLELSEDALSERFLEGTP